MTYISRLILCFLVTSSAALHAAEWVTVAEFTSPATISNGLAWDGAYLWLVGDYYNHDCTLFKIDPVTGATVESFEVDLPMGSNEYLYRTEGLAHDGTHLYIHVIDPYINSSNKIIRVNAADHTTELWEYNLGNKGQGLAWDDDRSAVWAVQGRVDDDVVSIINLVSGDEVLASIENDTLIAENDSPDGLGYEDGVLYVANNAGIISLVDVMDGSIIESFQGPSGEDIGPEGVAYDGVHIWHADLTNDKIYKIALVGDADQTLVLDAVQNCVDFTSSCDNIENKLQSVSLDAGAQYRVTLAGLAYRDDGNIPFSGSYLEYADTIGIQSESIRAGEYIEFTCPVDGNCELKAFLADDTPADNEGEFTLIVQRMDVLSAVEYSDEIGFVGEELSRTYPNPFNPQTRIEFYTSTDGMVKLSVFDVKGRLVVELLNKRLPRGSHHATWDGRDGSGRVVPSGVYLSYLEANGQVAHGRMTLIR